MKVYIGFVSPRIFFSCHVFAAILFYSLLRSKRKNGVPGLQMHAWQSFVDPSTMGHFESICAWATVLHGMRSELDRFDVCGGLLGHIRAVRYLLQLFHTHHCGPYFTRFLQAWKDNVMRLPDEYRPLHRAGQIRLRPGGPWEDAGNCTYLMTLRFLAPTWIRSTWQQGIGAVPLGNILDSSWATFSFAKERASLCMAAIRASSHICIRLSAACGNWPRS